MKQPILLPKLKRQLEIMGENIKLARLRRKLLPEQVSERANISLETLNAVEQGNSDITLAVYVSVLHVLGLSNDIFNLAKDDILGRKLQDIELLKNE
jgi:transcriptional regulator with XRE-family HTH domain